MNSIELLTQKQAASALGISVSTFKRHRKLPSFPAPQPIPGHPRWTRQDLDAWYGAHNLASIAMAQAQSALPDIDLNDIPAAEICRRLVDWYAASAERATQRGAPKVADLFSKTADALRTAGPRA